MGMKELHLERVSLEDRLKMLERRRKLLVESQKNNSNKNINLTNEKVEGSVRYIPNQFPKTLLRDEQSVDLMSDESKKLVDDLRELVGKLEENNRKINLQKKEHLKLATMCKMGGSIVLFCGGLFIGWHHGFVTAMFSLGVFAVPALILFMFGTEQKAKAQRNYVADWIAIQADQKIAATKDPSS